MKASHASRFSLNTSQRVDGPLQSPRWPADLDAQVMQTEGKYHQMSELAAKIDRPINAVLHRWHQLRAM